MTVNTLNITSGPYIGNDLNDTYSYDFRIDLDSQLSVYETDDTGVQTLLVLNTDYTVTDVGEDEGGSVVRTAGNLPTDYIWYIRSNRIENQLTDFSSQGAFFPDIHEAQFDHLTFLIQQLRDSLGRQFALSETIDIDGGLTISDVVADRIGKILGFDASGDLAIVTLNDDFITVYLGAFTTANEPTTDNQGNPLIDGALYYNTTTNVVRVYDLGTTSWITVNPSNQAVDINVTDTGDYFTGVNVETILQEVGENFVKQWTSASLLGSGLAITTITYPAIAALNNKDVAFIDDTNDELRTYRFDGSTWSLVGSGLAISSVLQPALAALNSTDVAFIDASNDSLRTYRFNGSTWSLVGSGLAISTVGLCSLAALNSTDVAFIDNTNDELRTYRFNGSTWSLVGSGLAIATVNVPEITALNSTDIAFYDTGNDELRTYRWSGSAWSLVGSGLSIPVTSASRSPITSLNESDVVFADNDNNELRVYRFNGSTWSQVDSGFVTASGLGETAMTTLNGTDIALSDDINDKLETYRFGFYIGDGPYHP
jgi:hypothetical protein